MRLLEKGFTVVDVEVFPNYALCMGYHSNGKASILYKKHDNRVVVPYKIPNETLVTFNGKRYDMIIIALMRMNASNELIYQTSSRLIDGGEQFWKVARDLNIISLSNPHIDVLYRMKGFGGLKLYAARNNCKVLQNFEFNPSANVDNSDMVDKIESYCANDCIETYNLLLKVTDKLEVVEWLNDSYKLRQDYALPEPTIGERVMVAATNGLISKPVVPEVQTIHYRGAKGLLPSKVVDLMKSHVFEVHYGQIANPKFPPVDVGGKLFTIGVGGIHTIDEPSLLRAENGYKIVDLDVSSYYPNIILNNDFLPAVMLGAYRSILNRRTEAVKSGRVVEADALKLVGNSIFGQLKNPNSALYNPTSFLNVVLSGQLYLLELAQLLVGVGARIVSANTDGIMIYVNDDGYQKAVSYWSKKTSFSVKTVEYTHFMQTSVSDYIARDTEGKFKLKGRWGCDEIFPTPDKGLDRNYYPPVIVKCEIARMMQGSSWRETMASLNNPLDYLYKRSARKGFNYKQNPLGKVARWVLGNTGECLTDSRGHKVPYSMHALPVVNLENLKISHVCKNNYMALSNSLQEDIGDGF